MRAEEWMWVGWQLNYEGEPVPVWRCGYLPKKMFMANASPKTVRRCDLSAFYTVDPFRGLAPSKVFSVLVEQKEPDVLTIVDVAQVTVDRIFATALVRLHRFIEEFGLLGFSTRDFPLRTGSQASPGSPRPPPAPGLPSTRGKFLRINFSWLASSRRFPWTRKNIAHTPNCLYVISSAFAVAQFLRTLLTCISMLRSKGENFRLSTDSVKLSRSPPVLPHAAGLQAD